jgi:hypothetical protein
VLCKLLSSAMHAIFVRYFSFLPTGTGRRSTALIIVLVLLLATAMAIWSRVNLNMQTASDSTVDTIPWPAFEAVTSHLIYSFMKEIDAGSEDDPLANRAEPVKQSMLLPGIMLTHGVAPQRAGDGKWPVQKSSLTSTTLDDQIRSGLCAPGIRKSCPSLQDAYVAQSYDYPCHQRRELKASSPI